MFPGDRFKLNIWKFCLQISCPKIENLAYKAAHILTSSKMLLRKESFIIPFTPPHPLTPTSPANISSISNPARPTLDLCSCWTALIKPPSFIALNIGVAPSLEQPPTGIASCHASSFLAFLDLPTTARLVFLKYELPYVCLSLKSLCDLSWHFNKIRVSYQDHQDLQWSCPCRPLSEFISGLLTSEAGPHQPLQLQVALLSLEGAKQTHFKSFVLAIPFV